MEIQFPSREHFRPQANKSLQSRIFFLYLKRVIPATKISSNRPKMTYFIHFNGDSFFGMLLEHWSVILGIFFPTAKNLLK
jgi:hypothetical protein